uniref:metal-dependent hydrolase n=1 Tax=Saccharibacillus sp. CPCC 101409 TaxID=3058041 RepID=UPI0034A0A858
MMHIFTHLIAGCFVASLALARKEISFMEKIFILGASSCFGILPDLLGPRDASPWSHSLIVMGALMLPLVYLLRFFFKKRSYIELYVCFAGSVFAHILVDYLGHGVHLIYPFSPQAYTLPLIYLGDPTLWMPMLLGTLAFMFPVKMKSRSGLNVLLLLFVLVYLGLKIVRVGQIEQKLAREFTFTPEAVVQVHPVEENQMKTFADFWTLGFDATDSQRIVRGTVPVWSGQMRWNLNGIYRAEGEVVVERTGKDGLEVVYRRPSSENEVLLEVLEEKKDGNDVLIVARDREGNRRWFIFRKGKWGFL